MGEAPGTSGGVVHSAVEETLNAMLDVAVDGLCQVERYERTGARKDTRAGSYERSQRTNTTFERLLRWAKYDEARGPWERFPMGSWRGRWPRRSGET
jgi:hypothetical protein